MKKTFVNTGLGVTECINSRMSRRVSNQGEKYAMERELPELFDHMVSIAENGGWHMNHSHMLEILEDELNAKEAAGIQLSAKTHGLLVSLREARTSH